MQQETDSPIEREGAKLRFLALGDSYTIGEGVDVQQAWPRQLVQLLNEMGFMIETPTVIAKTGWTTEELSEALSAQELPHDFDMVSLLIGVNDQYRGYPIDEYPERFLSLMHRALGYAATNACVFSVSIPDYGLTPFASEKELDAERIAKELDQYNRQAKGIANRLGVPWIDITPLSRERGAEKEMLAEDGLHPSGEMYRLWAEAMIPALEKRLRRS
jgi:lysophospholipase L1-like esterase